MKHLTNHLFRCAMTLAAAMLLILAPSAQAGRSCEAKKPTVQSIERGLTLAARTQAALDASGAQVVVLARAGQDLSKYGLRYSHLGLAYKAADAQGQPVWRVLHKLNQCGTGDGAIYRQGLGEFFLDDLWRYEATWVVPTKDVQEHLMAVLQDKQDPSHALRLNVRPYSIVSYVWGQKYQQSNQWAIETLAMAMEPNVSNRQQAQAWLQFNGYEPTTLAIGPLTRLGARASSANVAFDDHPNDKRFSDRIETVTVDSVFAWLQRAALGAPPNLLRL